MPEAKAVAREAVKACDEKILELCDDPAMLDYMAALVVQQMSEKSALQARVEFVRAMMAPAQFLASPAREGRHNAGQRLDRC